MMQANELKIGNWFQHSSGDYLYVDLISIGVEYKFMNPIPLTPEILIAAGFSFDAHNWVAPKHNNWQMKIYKGTDSYRWATSNWHSIGIEYVHQLQNLYFALTGTELNITP